VRPSVALRDPVDALEGTPARAVVVWSSVGVTAKVGPGVQDLNGCDIGHGYAYFCSRLLRTSMSPLSGEVPTTPG
jgi:hypothetical protein